MATEMNDYCNGIAYAIGYFANDAKQNYLVVRNLDRWYPEIISKETGYAAYESKTNFDRDGANQWVVKARNVNRLPRLEEICNKKDFCRAYLEIHGVLDINMAKNRVGERVRRLRLRVYGSEEVLNFITKSLPVGEKKLQYIKNLVDGGYIGETCALYYQSKKEILEILQWIDGSPKNDKLWEKWSETINATYS